MQPTLFTAAYSASRATEAPRLAAPIVDGDTTPALTFSGSARLIAADAAALSGHDHSRLSNAAS